MWLRLLGRVRLVGAMLVIVFACKTGDFEGERKCTKSGIGVVSFLNFTVMRVYLRLNLYLRSVIASGKQFTSRAA